MRARIDLIEEDDTSNSICFYYGDRWYWWKTSVQGNSLYLEMYEFDDEIAYWEYIHFMQTTYPENIKALA